jgi:hypothetical protein
MNEQQTPENDAPAAAPACEHYWGMGEPVGFPQVGPNLPVVPRPRRRLVEPRCGG